MTKPRKKQPLGQSIGGILFGFEQQVLRTMPPAQEMVHHARPDAPMPAGDGGLVTIGMPADGEPVLDSSSHGPGEGPCPADGQPTATANHELP